MAGIFTIAKCYFLPNFLLLPGINKIFIHFTHIERETKDFLCLQFGHIIENRIKKREWNFNFLIPPPASSKGKVPSSSRLACNIHSPCSNRYVQPKPSAETTPY